MSFLAVGGTLIAGGTIGAGTIAAGAALAGTAASLYGANKQQQANRAAQDQNIAQQDKQNAAQWTNWLMTRGVAPTAPVAAGEMPTSYTAVNTRLPLWASVNMASGPSRWQKVGRDYAAPNTLAVTPQIGGSSATTPIGGRQ